MHDLDAKLDRIAADPGTPYWARDIIAVARTKDPVDAASVLGHLSDIFNERCEAGLADALGQGPTAEEIRERARPAVLESDGTVVYDS